MSDVGARLGLGAVAVLVGLLACEVLLRLAGFSYTIAPQGVEFGWPTPQVMKTKYVTDPDLFWVTRDYHEKLQRLSAGRPDLVFMGDSCTEFGGYTREFLALSRAARDGWPRLAEHLGVSGYTTLQGLRQLRRDVAPLHPRTVTLYYGWNDHWLGFGLEDRQVEWVTHSWLARLDRLRLGQLLVKTRMALSVGPRSGWPRRVLPDDFRRNLLDMARVAEENGIQAVFITAPTSHEKGREPQVLARRWLNDVSEMVPLHQQYVSLVREAAGVTGAGLCDLARQVEAVPAEERAGLFMADGIHFTAAGDSRIARMLLDCFEADPRLRALGGTGVR